MRKGTIGNTLICRQLCYLICVPVLRFARRGELSGHDPWPLVHRQTASARGDDRAGHTGEGRGSGAETGDLVVQVNLALNERPPAVNEHGAIAQRYAVQDAGAGMSWEEDRVVQASGVVQGCYL